MTSQPSVLCTPSLNIKEFKATKKHLLKIRFHPTTKYSRNIDNNCQLLCDHFPSDEDEGGCEQELDEDEGGCEQERAGLSLAPPGDYHRGRELDTHQLPLD